MAELRDLYIVRSLPVFLSSVSHSSQDTMEKFAQGDPWIRGAVSLYDVFEPTLVKCGLERDDNLGHLVFGTERWRSMGRQVSKIRDPLTEYFWKRGKPPDLCVP